MSYLFLLALLSLLSLAFSIALSRAQSIYDCQAKLCYSRSDFPMGCGASALPGPSAGADNGAFSRACGTCAAPCSLKACIGACSLCGGGIAAQTPVWCCQKSCGFLACLECELHLSMMGDNIERLLAACNAFGDTQSASARDAATILEAHEMLESARSIKDVRKLQSVLATVEGLDVLIVKRKANELKLDLEEWEGVHLRLTAAMEGGSLALLQNILQEAQALKLQLPEALHNAEGRCVQLEAIQRLREAVDFNEVVTLQSAIAFAQNAQMNSELKEALDRAEVLHEKLSVFQRLEAALLAWEADALRQALADAGRIGAVDGSLMLAQAELEKMEVRCSSNHRLRRAAEFRDYFCHGCYAQSGVKELSWYRCDLCDFELCHHCLSWRARRTSAPGLEQPSEADPATTAKPATHDGRGGIHSDRALPTKPLQPDDEESQREWFNRWAKSFNAGSAHWELFKGGSWIPFGTGLSDLLTNAWQAGHENVTYTASNEQKHLFHFGSMEQVNLSTAKRRPMRRVLWEIELDKGWFLVEDDLALRLRLHQIRGVSSFQHFARDMEYTIDIEKMEQVNEHLGTCRKLRKIAAEEAAPKMSRQNLRMALEDDFSRVACAVRQWVVLRWPWQELGDCSIDAEGFIRTGLADEISRGLHSWQHETPQLGGLLQNILWFDHVDSRRADFISQNEVVNAIVQDPRWRWGLAGAEDAVSALWSELIIRTETHMSKREVLVAGGLADELLQILNSDLDSVDDWIMEKKLPLWEGHDCALCFCPIGKSDMGRRMRCGCWLHFECLGHGLAVKISEKAVDDAQMSMCPACGQDLGRVIPAGVVRRAVGEERFGRYLDVRVEVQWQKEALDSGRLVATCPSCSFLVLCNEREEMYSIKCLRQSCFIDRFCAFCSMSDHRPWTCEENERRLKFEDTSRRVRSEIESALAEALFRRCTGCGVPTERIDACCHMTCVHCGAEFSWVCGFDYHRCRASHPCLNSAIYLHCMPQLTAILDQRNLPRTDQNGSDLFLELRCIYLLSIVKRTVGDDAWNFAREQFPELLSDVIRGHWSIRWDDVGDVQRLTRLLPMAFPTLQDSL
ncbi:unnamed protein product [Durusdinium trenchii]|uniref:Uncharacterized protein n=2 Tax=Durusdinium trenchii TaxID=1381693 RepID=A0ABP0RTE0_9DINO